MGGYLLRKLPATNFFFLYFLAHNVEYGVLKEVLHCLALMVKYCSWQQRVFNVL